jgi:hypothetical protein
MAHIDDGLRMLIPLLKKDPTKDSESRRHLESDNEQEAKEWLVAQLRKMEEDETCLWTPRRSGTILCSAGMVSLAERSKGVAAFNKEEVEQ